MEGSRTNYREDSLSGNEVSPYFQRPRLSMQMAKGKEITEEVEDPKSTKQRIPSDKKCFVCAKERRKCSGIYPFTRKCGSCKRHRRRCYPEDEGKRKPQPAEEGCYRCRRLKLICDGTYPFTQACGPCQALKRITCTPEKTERGLPVHQRCYRCFVAGTKCFGEPPFKKRCGRCSRRRYRCYIQGIEVPELISELTHETARKLTARTLETGLPEEKKCQSCAKRGITCIGEPPFKVKCRRCKDDRRLCYAQGAGVPKPKVLPGLPHDKKCHRCAKQRRKCIGEPPFKESCGRCSRQRYKCFPQGAEVRRTVSEQETCAGCKRYHKRCDGKKPCTICVTKNMGCIYKDGDVKWKYQTDPKKWKEPTFPTCNQCVRWDISHFGKTLPCDGKSPCNCCFEDLGTSQESTNCTYHYENGISKMIRLHGERAQRLRKRNKLHRDRHNIKLREKLRREVGARVPQNDTTADAENLLDQGLLPNNTGDKEDSQRDIRSDSSHEESGSTSDTSSSDHDGPDTDAGWESDKEQSNQDHDHGNNHGWRSGFTNHKTSKSSNNPNQKRATGRNLSPPNDQSQRGNRKCSSLKGTPNQAQGSDSHGYGDGMASRLVDERGSKKRKISMGGSRESFGRRRL